ncbi:MAG: hypothetical protein KGL39_34425 [Patescibacteria group bacterium]|nr:hypothetical protein [Patescibacteria group bacterium]
MSTQPVPAPASPSLAAEILQAILAGLQIAAGALPLILQYKSAFGGSSFAPISAPIISHAHLVHPITGSLVEAALTPPIAAPTPMPAPEVAAV